MEKEDQELKIINRNVEYVVSKRFICSSVPYFEKMFCCDLLESKENKVELDFEEHVFDSILNWIHTGSFLIQMENVIRFYEAADYLMINERLLQPCSSYFHENFTIEHLPVILPQLTKVTKLINLGAMENFICRHFLLIVNTNVFLDLSFELFAAILKLDLMVHSEFQIFESIMKWVKKQTDSRKEFLSKLLNCVRWFFIDPFDAPKIKDEPLIRTMPDYSSVNMDNKQEFDRSSQNYFISIHKIDKDNLRIKVFDKKLFCLPICDFKRDDTMALKLVHGENISDIFFDSGRKGVRIDWVKKTFRWHEFKVSGENYYSEINRLILHFLSDTRCHVYSLEKTEAKLSLSTSDERKILESDGKFMVIGKTRHEQKWFGAFSKPNSSWLDDYKTRAHSFHVTVLDKVVYILTEKLEFIQYNYANKYFESSVPFDEEEFAFEDLILTSHQAKDDKVILVDKLSGKMYIYYVDQRKWVQKYQIMNVDPSSKNANLPVDKLITFTSAFLSMKNVKPLYKRKFVPF